MKLCSHRHGRGSAHSIRRILKGSRRTFRKVGVLLVTACFLVDVHAATYTWDAGSTTDYAWGTATNWDVAAADPATPPTAVDDVVFATPIPQPNLALPNPEQITLAAGSLANSITFNDSYTLSGGDLSLTSTGAGAITVASGKTATINSDILVSGVLGLNLSGGTGTLVLGGANTFVGPVNVGGATLSFGASNNLGDETAVTNSLSVNGGTLLWTGASATDLTANRTLAIGAGGATINTTGAGDLTVSGIVSGAGALTKSGTGTLVLSGTNLNSGAVDINGGTLSIADSSNLGDASATNNINFGGGTLTVTGTTDLGANRTVSIGAGGGTINTGANTVTVSGVLTSTLGNDLTKTGSGGTLILSGATANTTAGTININGGTVALNKTGVNAMGSGGALITSSTGNAATLRLDAADQIDNSAIIRLNANGGVAARFDLNGFNETVGGIVMSSTTFGSAHIATGAGVLTLNGDLEMFNNRNATGNTNREVFITGTGTYGTSTPSGTLDLGGAVRVFDIKTNNTQANNGATIETVIQNGGIIKAGNTALLLRNSNTFTGGLTVNNNVVDFNNDNNLGGASNVITLNGGGLRYNNNAGLAFTRTLNIGANGGEIGVAQTGGPLTLNTADLLKSAGATTMIKSGAGTLNLNAANPNLTATSWTVTGGTLVASSKAALGSAAAPDILVNGGTARLLGVSGTTATVGVNGFNAFYYNFGNNPQSNSAQFASDQLITGRVLARTDTNPLSLDLSPSTDYPRDPVVGFQVPDNLGMMWKGLLNITSGGSYTFRMSHDDHASLFIDGQELLANAGNTGGVANFRTSSAVTLGAGAHSIVVKFTQGGGGKYFRAQYSGADTSSNFEIIGSTAGTVTTGSLNSVAYGATGGNGTLDIFAPSTAISFSLADGNTFTLTSPTIDNLTITGASTLSTATTAGALAPTSGGLIFNAGIGESTVGSKLTIAGPYLTQFNAANSYTGITTVTGGRLELNAAGGNSIAGDLDVNAANASGFMPNVQLKQANQIADTAAVTVRGQGVLDIGANNDTIGAFNVSGNGQVVGLGTLNVANYSSSALVSGRVEVNLAGGGGGQTLTKTGSGTLALLGNNSFVANTSVSSGILALGGTNSLGAVANTVDVAANAVLAFTGGKTQTLGGVNVNSNGVLFNVAGANTLASNVTLAGGGTGFFISEAGSLAMTGTVTSLDNTNLSVSGAGDVILSSVPSLGSGSIAKSGSGFLIFNTGAPLGAVPTVSVSGTGGLGFGGTQNLGALNVPANTAFKFISDPGAGTTLNMTGGTVVAPTAINQTFLGRISGGSTGTLALAADSSAALNMSTAGIDVSLGAAAGSIVEYSGVLTPNAGAYRLGGGGGEMRLRSVLSGSNDLNISGPGIVYLYAGNYNTFTGGINVNAGTLRVVDNDSLGNPNNVVTLTNGAKLTLIQNTSNIDNLFAQLGNGISGAGRQIVVGTGGGIISVESYNQNGNRYVLSGSDPISGSGALTKADNGMLTLASSASYSGALTIADQGGSFEMRSGGALSSVSSVTLRNNGFLILDNKNGLGPRQFASAYVADRINDAATIDMRGGQITFRARNVAGNVSESLGALTAGNGFNVIRLERDGQGSQLTLANLIRSTGTGTIRFDSDGGTFGGTGNNPRVFLTQINGAAPATTNLIGGWATVNNNGTLDWAGYNATTGVVNSTYTAAANVAFSPTATNVINLTTAGTATLNAGNQDMLALRFGVGGGQTLAFSGASDTLFIGSGGVLELNSNQTRNIGSSGTRGVITAGDSAAAAGAKELFFHINQGTTNIESSIIDNNGAVTLIKDMGGTISLNSPNNTYSGGTKIYGGRINAIGAGSLGTGAVLVQGAALEIRVAGATTDTTGIIGRDQSEIYLQNGGIAYNGAGDRYIIEAGSSLTGNTTTANRSIASLTRVSSFTGGGQVILQPDAIVRSTDAPQGDIMTNMVANLGTAADLYYNQSGGFEQNQFITVGAGTPWKGISSSVGTGWEVGTIYANGDFWLQGLQRVGSNVSLTMGKTQSTGTWGVVNNTGGAINAFVAGQVVLNEDTPVNMPNDLTVVVTKDGLLQPNYANSFGDPTLYGTRASVVVRAGGVLDPGSYTPINPYNDPALFGMPYALPSPINTNLTVQAAGRFLLNDGSGAGSTTGGAQWTMKTDSILEVSNANVFLGSTSGLINNNQFVFEPGAIYRQSGDIRVFKLDQFVNSATNGQQVVYEVFGGDRNLTEAVNPFIATAVGTPTVAGHDLTISGAGMITNDTGDRHVRNRRGTIFLGNGATLAATTQSYLYMDQNFTILPGANVNIGYAHYVDGLPKLGTVRLSTNNNNTGDNTSTVTVLDGAQLLIDNTNVFPDAVNLHLPGDHGGSFGFPSPVSGSQLALNSNGNTEFIGKLTGDGVVYSNVDTGALGVGWGASSDFTFNGVFKAAWNSGDNRNDPRLIKVGSTKMTLTNTSDSLGDMFIYQGDVTLAGTDGRWTGGTLRVGKGATLTFDNSTDAVSDRFMGTGYLAALGGGEFRLLGHATQIANVTIANLANSTGTAAPSYSGGNSGGFGKITVSPAGDLSTLRTSVTFNAFERFDNAGERNSVWLVRGTGVAGLPGTYSTAGVYTPNAGNPKDGLTFITSPNLLSANNYGQNGNAQGFIMGGPGTPVVPVRGDLLAATSPTATEGDFATIDVASGANRTGIRPLQASEYANNVSSNATVPLNVRAAASTAINLTGDTRFQVIKLENGSSLNVSGTLPALTQPSQVVLMAGGILVPTGSTASINASGDAIFRTSGGVSAYVHAFGDLNVTGEFFSDLGLVKTGAGTATFAAGSLDNLRGRIVMHEGTLSLNDTLANVRNTATGAAAFDAGSHLELNGGTLNLNGISQYFNRLESGNVLAGAATEGGTLTSVAPATVTIEAGGTFSGHITGAVGLDKVGNNTLMLTNTNSTTGPVKIRQGTLMLRDGGTLTGVSTIDMSYARLDLDNAWLTSVPTRLNPTVTLNMRGGDFVHRGHAGESIVTNVGTVNLDAGTNLFQTLSGGGGSTELVIGNLVRDPGTFAAFQQNYGFIGTAGNDSTAIRVKLTQLNGGAVSLANNIIGGWAIVNNDHFATYNPTTGISYLGNTEDGYANYDSFDITNAAATATANVQDNDGGTITASKTINALRHRADGGARTFTLNSGVQLTIASGGILTNNNNQSTTFAGTAASITSGTSELYIWAQNNTTTFNTKLTGAMGVVVGGSGTVQFTGPGNDYTGTTYALAGSNGASGPSGALTLNTTGANGTTVVAVPGNLFIGNRTVNESLANQIAQTANVTLEGGSILNLVNAAATTETLASLTFLNSGGDSNPRAIITRSAAQATSTLQLTAATPITATNDNPVSTPALSQNLGQLAFTGADGAPQTLMVTSPVSMSGLSAAGLIINPAIIDVPGGVDDGGLVKAGTGLLTLGGPSTFGAPGSPTEVFNIQSGYVRVDGNDALGPNNAITTVQNGAVLLLNGNTVNGSLQLKSGSTLGLTLNSSTLGTTSSTGTVDVPTGATVDVQVRDYFVPSTNTGNIVVNHKLTGAGTINVTGIQFAAGYNGGGLFQLRNTANDFSGTFNVGTNAVLEANSNTGTGATFGTAAINLNGGVLRVRDQGDNLAGAQTIAYGNNITLSADSLIDVERQGSVATDKTIAFGTLTVPSGARVLNTVYGTSAGIAGNNFHTSFTQVAGAGTLVKGGTRFVDLNGYDGAFSGNIVVAGQQGLSLSKSGNLVLNAAVNNLNNVTVNGFHEMVAGKTVSVLGVLEVGDNVGTVTNGMGFNGASYVPVTTGGTAGSMLINSAATVNANTLRNKGVVGPTGGAGTVVATDIVGTGIYNALGNDLTLQGRLANDGANPTTLRVAGTNVVNLIPTASATATGGAEIQNGTLRIAPTSNIVDPLPTTGAIRVFGQQVSAVAPGSQAVNQAGGVLNFDGGGNTITQNSSIVNNGTVRVSTGNVTLGGAISGTSAAGLNTLANFEAATVPGLLEGTVAGGSLDTSATRPGNNGSLGITIEPRMGQTNVVTQNPLTGWTDNITFVYTGYFYDADGKFTFAENIDDRVLISIDGVTRLNTNGDRITSTAANAGQRGGTLDTGNINTALTADLVPVSGAGLAANPNLPAGWHSIEVRLNNGTGGAGTWGVSNGFTANYGFGLNSDGTMTLDGTQFFRPIDNGSGNLFRTLVAAKGNVQVDAGATLNVPQVNLTNRLIIGAAATGGTLNFNPGSATPSSADNLEVTGSTGSGTLNTNANTSLTVGNFSADAGTSLAHNATTNRLVITGNAAGGTLNSTGAAGVTFDSATKQVSTSVIAGNGGLVKQGAGTLHLLATNTYSGDTTLSTGTIMLGADNALPVSGATYWLDASDAASLTKDGSDNVSAWNDKSGNARNFVQATLANQPKYVAAGIGGKGSIRFDGIDGHVLTLASATAPQTVFIVNTPDAANAAFDGIFGTNNPADKGIRMTDVTTYQHPGDGNDLTNGTGGAMYITLTGGTTAGGSIGAAATPNLLTAVHGTSVNAYTTTNLGGYFAGRGWAGDMGEVIVYNGNLSNADRQTMQTWLQYKWLGAVASNFIPDASAVTLAASTNFNLNNFSETVGSIAGSGNIALGAGTLTAGGNDTSTSYAGAISGTGGFTKSGLGTTTLTSTNTYTGATAVNAGTLRVDGSIAASSGVTVAGSATFVAGATQVVKTLDLSAASSNASILAGAIRVLSVGDNTAASPLTLTGGKLDLNTSALIVDFSAGNEPANLAAMKTAILAGRGTGVWDGTSGLTSTAAAAAASVYGVGYAPSSIASGAIAGVTPDADAVVARYTRLGDANLDGAVNFFDLTALAAAYGSAGEWYNGDFDYSGTINFFDLTALAANYGTGLPSEAIPGATPEFSADLAAAFASVPEPGAISLLGLAALALLKRRNNRKAA